MKRKSLVLLITLVLAFSFMGCAALQIKDPVKTGLYAIKQEWVSVREYMIMGNLNGTITDKQLDEFQNLDVQFSALYEFTVNMYISGTEGVDFDTNLHELRNLLLKAREKYYKGGK